MNISKNLKPTKEQKLVIDFIKSNFFAIKKSILNLKTNYKELSLDDCYTYYFYGNIVCECNGDAKFVTYKEE